jgi:hypothetical protein
VNRLAGIGSMFSCLLPPSMTGHAPVGSTDQQQRLLQPAVVPFSGTGFKTGSVAEESSKTTVAGLSDRRERMRQAALNRMQTGDTN